MKTQKAVSAYTRMKHFKVTAEVSNSGAGEITKTVRAKDGKHAIGQAVNMWKLLGHEVKDVKAE